MPRTTQKPQKNAGPDKAVAVAAAAALPDGAAPAPAAAAPVKRPRIKIAKPLGVAPKQKGVGKRRSDVAIKRNIRFEISRADRVRAIPRAPFLRLFREIIADLASNPLFKIDPDMRIALSAVDALQTAAEAYTVNLMTSADMVRLARKQMTLAPVDIKTVLLINTLQQ